MRRFLTVLGVLMVCGGAQAADQDLTPFQKALQFNFGNPGARALGMGGAFLGRADDASAAEANPAGLTVISKREFTVEFRNISGSSQFPASTIPGTATTPNRLVLGDVESAKTSNITFASFAMPVGPVAVAAYYHVPLDFSAKGSVPSALTFTVPGTSVGQVLMYPSTFDARYKSRVIGLAAAWRIGQFSLGASGKHQSIDILSTGQTYSDPSKPTTTLRDLVTLRGNQSKTSYNVGLLWTSRTETLTFGAVYKKGATFEATTSRFVCEPKVLPAIADTSKDLSAEFTCPATANAIAASPFQIPDRYGVGMSVRFRSGFTINEDIVRVKYSQQLTGFRSSIYCDAFARAGYTSADGSPNPFCTAAAPDPSTLGYSIPDATEVHIGAEYRLPRSPIALRVGGWSTPPHQVDVSNVTLPANAATMKCKFGNTCQSVASIFGLASTQEELFFTGGETSRQVHITAGIGYLARSFEINAGYDHSSRSKTASFQVLTRF